MSIATERKTEGAKRAVELYTRTGCYTTADWNAYAASCKVLGIIPFLDPLVARVPITHVGGPI
jgi:hypothetical protein